MFDIVYFIIFDIDPRSTGDFKLAHLPEASDLEAGECRKRECC